MKNIIIVILMLSLFATLVISSMLQKSGTCDEIAHHIPAGVINLMKSDLKFDTSQPPLLRYIVAAPVVLFLKPQLPDEKEAWRIEDRAQFGRDFFFKYNNGSRGILFISRLMVALIGVLCGLVIFIWSKKLYGIKMAIFSLFLYIFSPNILAHARLATTDMAATFFILLSCYIFWRFFNNRSKPNLVLAGISLGLAQLSKYSAFILYPIFIIIFICVSFKIKDRKRLFLDILLIFLISAITIWAGYGFRAEPLLKNTMRAEEKLELITSKIAGYLPSQNEKIKEHLSAFLLNVPVPLGEHFIGILGVLRHSQQGQLTYFFGSWLENGNILYFIIAFLIKTPIPIIFLLIAGLFISVKRKFSADEYFIVIPPLIYFIIALFSNLQVGLRHILPIYPFCFIMAAKSISLLRYKIFKIIIPLICVWYIFSSLFIWPDYLSYFNEFIGGPNNGWKYLRDSNIDWGQDLPALAKYMKDNKIKEVTLEYFGEDRPGVYGIEFKRFRNREFLIPEEKVYAVSAQYLEHVKWSEDYKPTAKAGYSIFIYDMRNNKVSA